MGNLSTHKIQYLAFITTRATPGCTLLFWCIEMKCKILDEKYNKPKSCTVVMPNIILISQQRIWDINQDWPIWKWSQYNTMKQDPSQLSVAAILDE